MMTTNICNNPQRGAALMESVFVLFVFGGLVLWLSQITVGALNALAITVGWKVPS